MNAFRSKLEVLDTRKLAHGTHSVLLVDFQTLEFYYAETASPQHKIESDDPWTDFYVRPKLIDPARVAPRFDEIGMTLAPSDANSNYWLYHHKKVNYLTGMHGYEIFASWPVCITQREIYTNENLRRFPHPNVCQYLGVLVWPRIDYVYSLVFTKYSCDLQFLVQHAQLFDPNEALAHIEAGIKHLHSLGLVHCDVKPSNIFVVRDEHAKPVRFVLGDFDSCHPIGSELQIKMGTHGWTHPRFTHANPENDFYGLARIRWWLSNKGWGNPAPQACTNPHFYPSTSRIFEMDEENDVVMQDV